METNDYTVGEGRSLATYKRSDVSPPENKGLSFVSGGERLPYGVGVKIPIKKFATEFQIQEGQEIERHRKTAPIDETPCLFSSLMKFRNFYQSFSH